MPDPGQAALERAQEKLKSRTAASLIKSIEEDGYEAQPGPIKNRLEWQEICRRLLENHEAKAAE